MLAASSASRLILNEDDIKPLKGMKTTSNGRQPPMEDDLQWKLTSNIKIEYLSNH
jgi:hypothetical protein